MPKIWEMITEETWCKGQEIGARCSIMWIASKYRDENLRDARNKFRCVNDSESIIKWNDAPERTFAEVKEAFRKADL